MSDSDGSSRLSSETVAEKANNRRQCTEIGSQSTEREVIEASTAFNAAYSGILRRNQYPLGYPVAERLPPVDPFRLAECFSQAYPTNTVFTCTVWPR
ncbi:hypothetical protein GB937_008544 [Aspergillus fischeri]|nr:hypothetical protein GB937_008544 [Aspergillus fischeri]